MASTKVLTILFSDLVASTERRARLGDDAFDDFTHRLMAALEGTVAEHRGRVVKKAGDGLMVVFPDSVADAIACATTMHRACAELDPHDPPQLRIGISSGEVADHGDDFSGMPIVEAARLEAAATPGQTLASSVVRTLVGTRRAFRFRDIGALTLKGIPTPLSTVEVIDDQILDVGPLDGLPPGSTAPRRTVRRRNLRTPIAAGAVMLLVVAAVTGFVLVRTGSGSKSAGSGAVRVSAPEGYTPRYTASPCPPSVQSTTPDTKCGHLVVPQDRTKPFGQQVSLLVTSAPARSGPATDPTIDVCGCENFASSPARDHSELIQVAVRGFAGSDPELTCPQMTAALISALALPSTDPKALAATTEAAGQCRTQLVASGVNPSEYNYDTAAHDLLDLMVALHIHRANFIASEGYDIEVLDVLRQAPAAVRSMTFDNPPPPGMTRFTDPVGDLSGAFHRFVAVCDAAPTCAHAYPNLETSMQRSREAIAAHPALVTTGNPYGGNEAIRVFVDSPRAADAMGFALSQPSAYPLIPEALTSTNQATGRATIAAGAAGVEYPSPDLPWGALASFTCAYEINTQNAQGVALEAHTLPHFAQAQYLHWAQWCKAWNVADVSALLSQSVASNVPTLVFRGDLSPQGNPNWIPELEQGLSQVQSVVFPTLGGDLLSAGPPCLSLIRRQFLASPTRRLDTTRVREAVTPSAVPGAGRLTEGSFV